MFHRDPGGITAGCGDAVAPYAVISPDSPVLAITELFGSCLARLAFSAGIHEAADSYPVTNRKLGYFRADFGDDSGDFMTGGEGVDYLSPFRASGVNIRVADPGIFDLEVDFGGPWFAPL